jgi:hypothetical protein
MSRVACFLVSWVLAIVLVAAFAPSLAAQTWTATGSMNVPRWSPLVTLLANGKVLVAGGFEVSLNETSSAELYDPTTGTFTLTGSMTTGRVGGRATATLLQNGQVLIAGGCSYVYDNSTSSAELFDPASGTFTATGSMTIPRASHTATLLPNGQVLITGGLSDCFSNSAVISGAELYDPTTGTFSSTGNMDFASYFQTATLLGNGQVLVTGGTQISNELANADLYNPTTGLFTPTGSMTTGRSGHTATLLNNGQVLVVDGTGNSGFATSAELYNPSTGAFSATGSMTAVQAGESATLLPTGQVLIAGGETATIAALSTAEIYDPTTGTFTVTSSMTSPRLSQGQTLLNSGFVLVVGGYNDSYSYLASAELYGPGSPAPLLAFTPGIITSVAGGGSGCADQTDSLGDGCPATSGIINGPIGVVVDNSGNLYIAEGYGARVRKVNTSGVITTVAGNTTAEYSTGGYSGDGGPATSAEISDPSGVAVDSAGNLYIADEFNQRIREVNTSGIITTVAGNGTAGYSGDGGPATSAELNFPVGLAVDSLGNLYIADGGNAVIRKVNASGVIATVVGNGTAGYSGDGGPATGAELNFPYAVAVDSAGNLYIADESNNVIRKVNASGIITTVAGNGTSGYNGDNIAATTAKLNSPAGVAVDSAGDFYFADNGNDRIRKVDINGTITTVAGNGVSSYGGDGGPATRAELRYPYGPALDSAGDLYIADWENDLVREVNVGTSALSFGSLNVGQTSSAQSVAVSDVGNAPLNLSSIIPSANFVVESVGNDCVTGTPLGVGATCELGAAFAPTIPGNPLTGALTVSDDAFNNPQSVSLSGIGIATVASQTITFTTSAPSSAAYNSIFTVAATGGASGNPVTFTSSGACSNVGATYTITSGTGTCSVIANQAGNTSYSAAPQVTQSTTATKATSTTTITSNAPNPSTVGQAVAVGVKVTGNGTPTGNVTVTATLASSSVSCTATLSSGAGTCSVTLPTAGIWTLTAAYGGDGNFGTSTSAGVSQTVNPVGVSLTMGPQAMEGNLQLSAGTTLEVGYDFTMPGNHPAATVSFFGAQVTFAWKCVSGSGSGTLVVPMANQSYTDTQNSSAWYPSGVQNSSLVYQGSIAVPNVCSGGSVSFQAGGTFSTGISSTDTTDKVNVRWHYSGNGSAGSWSGTQSVVP